MSALLEDQPTEAHQSWVLAPKASIHAPHLEDVAEELATKKSLPCRHSTAYAEDLQPTWQRGPDPRGNDRDHLSDRCPGPSLLFAVTKRTQR